MSVTSKTVSSPNMFNTASPTAFGGSNPFCPDRFASHKLAIRESRIPDQAPSASPISNLTKGLNTSLHLDSSPNSPDHAPLLKMLDVSLGSHTPRLFKRKYDLDSSIEDSSFGMMLQANSPSAASLWESRPTTTRAPSAKSSGLAPAEDFFMGGSVGSANCSIFSTDDENTSFDENGSCMGRHRLHRRQQSLTLMLDSRNKHPEPQLYHQDFSTADALTPLRSSVSMKRARSQSSALLTPLPPTITTVATQPLPAVDSPRSPECGVLPCQSAPTDTIKRIDASTLADPSFWSLPRQVRRASRYWLPLPLRVPGRAYPRRCQRAHHRVSWEDAPGASDLRPQNGHCFTLWILDPARTIHGIPPSPPRPRAQHASLPPASLSRDLCAKGWIS